MSGKKKESLHTQRRDYKGENLDEATLSSNPGIIFREWIQNAIEHELEDATACALSTVSRDYQVSSRMVLLKYFESDCFWFFGNYNSRKSIQMAEVPHASLLFYWKEYARQIRIEGSITRAENELNDNYFQSRPRLSQIAAVISDQSRTIESRQKLEEKFSSAVSELKDAAIPRPENWGGWKLTAHRYEFWQGQENRLHDRIEFIKNEDNWIRRRLQP